MVDKWYLVKDSELDGIAHHKDIKTRILMWNQIKARGNANSYIKEWRELKEWLESVSNKYLERGSFVRHTECDRILFKMREIDERRESKSVVTMWFTGMDCKKCNGHIYTDGRTDWCTQGCSKNANPASWRE